MTWVYVAVGAGTLVSGYLGSRSANKASKAAQEGSQQATAEARRQFDLVRSDTAGQRFIGNGATNTLARLYGYGPVPQAPSTGVGSEAFAGAAPVNSFAPVKPTVLGGSLNVGGNLVASGKLGAIGKLLDPAAAIFGSKHGDENRNLKAFGAESGVMQLPDGRLALPNGAIFNQNQLKDVAGTWYGAVHAPDGNQADWQQRYGTLITGLGGSLNATGNAGGGQTSDGVPNSAPLSVGAPAAGPDLGAFFASPDYQFRLDEGQKAIDRSAAARGGLLSGGAQREGIRYASNTASGEFGAFVDRLMQQAGLGSTGIGASASAGANTAGLIGNAAMTGANARGSAYLTGGSAINNSVQGGLQNFLLAKYLGG